MRIKGKGAIANILRCYSSQFISMLTSMLLTLYMPKFLGVEQFSYWQLFLFYAAYTPILQLGLSDGIYLKYGGVVPTNRDKSLISGQLWTMVMLQGAVLLLAFAYVCLFVENPDRRTVFMFVVFYAVLYNIFAYCSYAMQALNIFKRMTRGIIFDKLSIMLLLIVVIVFGWKHYELVIAIFSLGLLICDAYYIAGDRSLFLSRFKLNRDIFRELVGNAKCGINLMIANIASLWIIGVGRFLIDVRYPIEIFGLVSFAFTLNQFILVFLSQIGTAIYPILKTKDDDFHKLLFPALNLLLSKLLPIALLVFPLLTWGIDAFLPKYHDAVQYFICLFPLCLFESKNNLLYNTYFKVMREERSLLKINLLMLAASSICAVSCVFWLKDLQLLLIGMTCCVMLKSFILCHAIGNRVSAGASLILSDAIISIAFIIANLYLGVGSFSWGIILVMVIFEIVRNKKKIASAMKFFMK